MDAVYTVRLKDKEIDLFEEVFSSFASNDPRLTRSAFMRYCVLTHCQHEKDTDAMLADMAEVYDIPDTQEE